MGEIVARGLGVKFQHVHYRGAAPAMNDMLGGIVDSNVEALTNSAPNHKAGMYRALAVLSEQRSPQMPDVPTFKELGYPALSVKRGSRYSRRPARLSPCWTSSALQSHAS